MSGNLWVDYKQVKSQVSIEDILKHYGLIDKFTRKGDRLSGPCPVHKGSNPKQFSVDLKKGAWKCFSAQCGVGGNIIDLVASVEGVDFRDAALLIQGWFGITPESKMQPKNASKKSIKHEEPAQEDKTTSKEAPAKEESIADSKEERKNKPLGFQLKLEQENRYLEGRGLTPLTVEHFGLGLASKGSFAGRIAIPIHDHEGNLVAYAGRSVGEGPEVLDAGEGKYKLPAGFHKSLVVFNLHRVPSDAKRVVLTEGFFQLFWLHQHGYQNVVSVMGSSISAEQVELLAKRFKGVQIFFDGDEAGREGARKVALDLAPKAWVKIVSCPEGLQPDGLPAHELKRLLS